MSRCSKYVPECVCVGFSGGCFHRVCVRGASETGLLRTKERKDTRAFYDPPRCLLPPLLLAFHLLALGLRSAFSFSFPWRSRKCCHRGSAARVYDLLVGVLSFPLLPFWGLSLLVARCSILSFLFSMLSSEFSVFVPCSPRILRASQPRRHLLDNHLGIFVSMYLYICICVDCAATETNGTNPSAPCVKVNSKYYFLDTLPSGRRRVARSSNDDYLLPLVLLPVRWALSCGAPGVPGVAFEV